MLQARHTALQLRIPETKEDMKTDLIDFVLKRNQEQSADFCDPSVKLSRQKYRKAHPTEILAFKCMDGRLNLAVMTETPAGIIRPFRNVGGRFNLGWPFFGELLREHVGYAISENRAVLVFVTYHFSKGDNHRGCKGFGYDTATAKKNAEDLAAQVERVYGKKVRVVHPIVVGIETDDDSLIFHGENGASLNISESLTSSSDELKEMLAKLYPDMLPQTLSDLMPLVSGNQEHVQNVRKQNREPIDLDHREQIIAVGRGFDWLHLPNRALIVGPYDHDWPSAVATAGGIVLDNIKNGRVPAEQGALLLVSSLSRDEMGSYGWNTAVEKAIYLERIAHEVLKERVPELTPYLSKFSGVLDEHTRKFQPL
jgi:hypothetical protein